MGMATCRGCGAEIVWLELNGKNHPCDLPSLRVIYQGHLVEAHTSHFATCPKAGEFRRR
jgi:hypothetical protein